MARFAGFRGGTACVAAASPADPGRLSLLPGGEPDCAAVLAARRRLWPAASPSERSTVAVDAIADGMFRAERVTKVHPNGIRANDEIRLHVAPGEVYGLLGPNGAGLIMEPQLKS